MAWPTTNDPKTEFVTVRFTVNENDELDTYAKMRGLSRSAFVRDATSRVIEAEKRRAKRNQPSTSRPSARLREEDE